MSEPGTGYLVGGTLYRRLALDRRTATLHGDDDDVTGEVAGLDPATEERLWQLWRSFRRRGEELLRDETAPADALRADALRADALRADALRADALRADAARFHQCQLEAGQALGRAFLTAEVAGALGDVLDPA